MLLIIQELVRSAIALHLRTFRDINDYGWPLRSIDIPLYCWQTNRDALSGRALGAGLARMSACMTEMLAC